VEEKMSLKDSYQKIIDKYDRRLKFYQSIFLALISATIWTIYAILENKVDEKVLILTTIGVIILVFVVFRINGFKINILKN
jgi:hypothetical protein